MKNNKFICLLLSFILIFGFSFNSFSATQNDLNKKTNEKNTVQKNIDKEKNKQKEAKKESLELTVDKIREKYGKRSIVRSVILTDTLLEQANKPNTTPPAFYTH